jgi:hypothetical protein
LPPCWLKATSLAIAHKKQRRHCALAVRRVPTQAPERETRRVAIRRITDLLRLEG